MMNEIKSVRPSPIAGTWYSANPDQLRRLVNAFIEDADVPQLPGEVVALVAPHAGYIYSGSVAGHAFKTVNGLSFDLVCVISPMHQYYAQPLLTSAHSAYRTPLGEIPLANNPLAEINDQLTEQVGFGLTAIAHDQEHSLEIELPFLQSALKGAFSLIPLMMRDQSRGVAKALGTVLSNVLAGKNCLIVASSDLSHFYTQSQANRLDERVLRALADFSPEGLFDLKEHGQGHACGLSPIASTLWASAGLGAQDVTLLKYDTSAATTGDTTSVVGYGAAAITRPV
jgi:AmmeMemoRadiSam system protein B